jgi:hypothetical protein
LIIGSFDDGTRINTWGIPNEIRLNCNDRVLTDQLSTDCSYNFEYRNRTLLGHNHKGGITFTMETPQEAVRCMNLRIHPNGRKYRVFAYTRSKGDDLCTHCSAWGHLERNCSAVARCGICSKNHRIDSHIDLRNGKCKILCLNCVGNHHVQHSSCKVKSRVEEKETRRTEEETLGSARAPSCQLKLGKSYGKKGKLQIRGAPNQSGPGR